MELTALRNVGTVSGRRGRRESNSKREVREKKGRERDKEGMKQRAGEEREREIKFKTKIQTYVTMLEPTTWLPPP